MKLSEKDYLKGAILSVIFFSIIGCSLLAFVWGYALDISLIKIGLYVGIGLSLILAYYNYYLYKKGGAEYMKELAGGLGGSMTIIFILGLVGALITGAVRHLF